MKRTANYHYDNRRYKYRARGKNELGKRVELGRFDLAVEAEEAVNKFLAAEPPSNKCLRPDCTRPARCRGLCPNDYQVALKMVQKGETTWKELEKKGKVRPKTERATVKNWFLS